MRSFIITVKDLPSSEMQTANCIASANKFDIHPEIFKATTRYESLDVLEQIGIRINPYHRYIVEFKTQHNEITPTEIACALSHFRLYVKCVMLDKPILILEHDAIFEAAIPNFEVDEFVNVAFTVNARNQTASTAGLYSYMHNDLKSAAGYCISPKGATKIINHVQQCGIRCADTMIKKNYLNLQEYIPYPIRQTEGVSSIQANKGRDKIWQEYKG